MSLLSVQDSRGTMSLSSVQDSRETMPLLSVQDSRGTMSLSTVQGSPETMSLSSVHPVIKLSLLHIPQMMPDVEPAVQHGLSLCVPDVPRKRSKSLSPLFLRKEGSCRRKKKKATSRQASQDSAITTNGGVSDTELFDPAGGLAGGDFQYGSKLSVDGKSDSGSRGSKDPSNESHSRSSSPKPAKSKGHERKPSNHSSTGGKLQTVASSVWNASLNLINPTYKTRCEEFKKFFKLPEDKFVIDYSCALQKDILVHGRMYLSVANLSFYAKILNWETNMCINLKDVTHVTKEKTAKVIPNAIQICTTSGEKLFFTSFAHRDRTFMILFKIWQYCLLDVPLTPADLWASMEDGYEECETEVAGPADEDGEEAPSVAEGSVGGPANIAEGSSTNLMVNGNSDLDDRASSSDNQLMSGGGGDWAIGDGPDFGLEGARTGRVTPASMVAGSSSGAQQCNGGTGIEVTPPSPTNGEGFLTSTPERRSSAYPAVPRSRSDIILHGVPRATFLSDERSESSENDGDGSCTCPTHHGKEMLSCVLPVSVDQLFLLMFTESNFSKTMMDERKVTEITFNDWHTDHRSGTKSRQLSYTIQLNHPMGPKTSPVVEKQSMAKSSQPGRVYVVKSEVQNFNIPYSDTFYVLNTYCISRISPKRCRLRVHGGVLYRKNCWGIVKNFIEKNALAGMQEYFTDLDNRLQEECDRMGLGTSSKAGAAGSEEVGEAGGDAATGDARGLRRRRGQKAARGSGAERQAGTQGGQLDSFGFQAPRQLFSPDMDFMAKAVIAVLLVMVCFNVVLFYKLWSLQAAMSDTAKPTPALPEFYDSSFLELKLLLQKSELSREDWLRLFQTEHSLHRRSVHQWSALIGSTIEMIEKMESALRDVKSEIRVAQLNAQAFASAVPDNLALRSGLGSEKPPSILSSDGDNTASSPASNYDESAPVNNEHR